MASQCVVFDVDGTVWWSEATDEPAREDARPTENANGTAPLRFRYGRETRTRMNWFVPALIEELSRTVIVSSGAPARLTSRVIAVSGVLFVAE